MHFKTRITLWFSAVLLLVFAVLFFMVTLINNAVLQQNVKGTLIKTVNSNLLDVEFSLTQQQPEEGTEYIAYGSGYIIIDRRFLKIESGVHSSLYSPDGALLYGENPVADVSPVFSDGVIKEAGNSHGVKYYVFDRMTESGLWLRGVISEEESRGLVWNTTKLILLVFPLAALIAVAGGYRIASHFTAPINEIRRKADKISKGDDLSERLPVTRNDETGKLSQSFNLMFERLEKNFEREKRFNRDVSHELRTPISVISAEAEYGLDRERSADEYREILKTILEKSGELTEITQSLLTLSRLESTGEKPEMSPLSLKDAMEAALKQTPPAASKNIEVKWQSSEDVSVIGNEPLLIRLFSNLISNAYKYGRENGCVSLSIKKEDGKAVAEVADDGIGVPEEECEKIFDRFYRAENAGKTGGSGIGLAIVKEIAALHGADIKCISGKGKGSVFVLTMDAI